MKIVVCVKQVPNTMHMEIDKKTNNLIRDKVDFILNPFDVYAIEEGVRIKEQIGDSELVAMSMGVMSTEKTLKEAISLGVDQAILLHDKKFAGADTLATAYTLAKGMTQLSPIDLIICGRQAIDGDTAQVGPSLATKLNIPYVTNVKKVMTLDKHMMVCHRLTESGYDVIQVQLPALITVVKDINVPRLPSLKDVIKANKATVEIWDAQTIGADIKKCGRVGSPTRVMNTYKPHYRATTQIIEGKREEQVKVLVNKLRQYI